MIKDIADSRRANTHVHAEAAAAKVVPPRGSGGHPVPVRGEYGAGGPPLASLPMQDSPLSPSGSGNVVMGTPTSSGAPQALTSLQGGGGGGDQDYMEVGSEGGEAEVTLAGADFSAAIVSHLFWPKPDPRNKEKVSHIRPSVWRTWRPFQRCLNVSLSVIHCSRVRSKRLSCCFRKRSAE